MKIRLKTNKNLFRFYTEGKINIITGNSATRKSEFVNACMKFKKKVSTVHLSVQDDLNIEIPSEKIIVLGNTTLLAGDITSYFHSIKGGLFIIDETNEVLHQANIGNLIKESQNYFLIITREIIKWLPISIDSIYKLECNNKEIVNVPYYCERNKDLIKIDDVDFIVSEDSKSSSLFFKHYFSDKVIFPPAFKYNNKSMMKNNTNIHLTLNSFEKQRVLIVVDAAAYGPYYGLLLNSIKQSNNEVSLLTWDSFETYILGSKAFNCHLTKLDVNCNYNSLEQLSYTELCRKINYNKSKLPDQLKNNPNIFVYGELKNLV